MKSFSQIRVRLLVFMGVLLFMFQNCVRSDASSSSSSASNVETLTTALVEKASAKGTIPELEGLAAKRQEALLKLVRQQPVEALRLMIPDEKQKHFPPHIDSFIEKSIEMEGELVVLHVDDFARPEVEIIELELHTEAGEVHALHLSKNNGHEIATGTQVRVKGFELIENLDSGKKRKHVVVDDQDILVLSADSSVSYGSQPGVQANTIGVQKTLVMMVNFQDAPSNKPWTVAAMQSLFSSQINPYYHEVSYGQTSFNVTVFGWQTIATTSTSCDRAAITNLADQAAVAAGYVLSNYDRLVYSFPVTSACGWGGLGTVGGLPSRSWFNGSFNLSAYAHELGHNLGLFHSHDLKCSGQSIGVIGAGCSVVEYGNLGDLMGSGRGHFNIYQKYRLGWINSSLVTVTSSGRYRIAPQEFLSSSLPLGLKVLKSVDASTGSKTWYHLEYRQYVGADQYLSSYDYSGGNLNKGLSIHTGAELNGNTSHMLDMTPENSYWFDAALMPGKQFVDSAAGISITTVSANSSEVVVDIQLGDSGGSEPVCAKAAPQLSFSPGQSSWVVSGTVVNFNMVITNKDSSACAVNTFTLSSSPLSGWTVQLAQSTVSLAPGASATVGFSVKSPSSAVNGFYNIKLNAISGSYSAEGTVTYVVDNPPAPPPPSDTISPSVSITSPSNGSVYSPRTSIAIQATASDNVAVSRVEFYVNGGLICTDTTANYACGYKLPGAKGASYRIEARAYDSANNMSSSVVTISSSTSAAAK